MDKSPSLAFLARYRKLIAAVLGGILTLVAGGALPADVAVWAQAITVTLTALGVYQVPNAPQDSE